MHLDGRLRLRVLRKRARVFAVVHDNAEAFQREMRLIAFQVARDEQVQRAVGHFVGMPGGLAYFHLVEDQLDTLGIVAQVKAERCRLRHERRLARQLAYEHVRAVADRLGTHVFVSLWKPRDGARVQPALVCECGGPDVGCVFPYREVADLGDVCGDARELA